MNRLIPALLVAALSFSQPAFSQYSAYNKTILGYLSAKEYSKELSLYHAKTFLMFEVLGSTTEPVQFEIDPLTAATSGELTTLVYRCVEKNQEGLILGFWGNRVTEAGVQYNSYSFKNLPIEKARALFELINQHTKNNSKFLELDNDNHNFYFVFDDITLLIYDGSLTTKIRVYWNGFDSETDWATFKKMEKKLNKKLQ